MSYRKIIQQNNLGKQLLSICEKAEGKIVFRKSNMNEWEPQKRVISVSGDDGYLRTQFLGWNWENRVLFHEFGHVILDDLWHNFDKIKFKKLFNGSPHEYPQGFKYYLKTAGTILSNKVSVTRYGKLDPNEAWAEAFSFVLNNVEDHDLSTEQIEQLAFVDWTLSELLSSSGKRKVRPYKEFKIDSECAWCTKDIKFGPCRMSLDVAGWEATCPYCFKDIEFC